MIFKTYHFSGVKTIFISVLRDDDIYWKNTMSREL
jgi:hypothetical protein